MKTEKDRKVGALLTRSELAAEFGVNVATVARWRKLGCPYVETRPLTMRRYTRPRYDVEQVIAWLEGGKKGDEA